MTGLDSTFFALSDPTRRAILARLASGEATVMQLAEPFEMSQPAVSRHLRVLEDAGLITRRVEGARRPCRLRAEGIQAIEQWLAMMREAFTRNYSRLDEVLADMQTQTKGQETP
jgi:DNA-binding transcriptional ArsR family regulator